MEATVWFEKGALNKKRSNLHVLCTSQPVLRFQPSFNPHTWYTDPFVLFQNAIRHEIDDLYAMLRSAALHVHSLRASDAEELQKWVAEFSQLVSLYFLVQERLIYPMLARRAETEVGLSVGKVKKETKGLVGMLLEVHKESLGLVECCRARENKRVVNFDNEWVYESLGKVSEAVSRFVGSAEEMFEWEVGMVGRVVERKMEREEAREMERRCVLEVLSYEVGEKVWGGISAWIPGELKRGYLEGMDVRKMGRLRRRERKWFKGHKSLASRFGRNGL